MLPETWAEGEFGDANLGDVRRNARLMQLASALEPNPAPCCQMPALTQLLKATYRFFSND